MGTSTVNSQDPRTPAQKRGNRLVLFVVLAMAGAAAYGYFYVSAGHDAGESAAVPRSLPAENAPQRAGTLPDDGASPTTAATPVTRE